MNSSINAREQASCQGGACIVVFGAHLPCCQRRGPHTGTTSSPATRSNPSVVIWPLPRWALRAESACTSHWENAINHRAPFLQTHNSRCPKAQEQTLLHQTTCIKHLCQFFADLGDVLLKLSLVLVFEHLMELGFVLAIFSFVVFENQYAHA